MTRNQNASQILHYKTGSAVPFILTADPKSDVGGAVLIQPTIPFSPSPQFSPIKGEESAARSGIGQCGHLAEFFVAVGEKLVRGRGEELVELCVEGLGEGLTGAFHVAMRPAEWFGHDFVGNA